MKNETQIYQMAVLICFVAMIGSGWKYTQLKGAYKISEKERVEYCIKYYDLKCNK